MSYDFVTLDPAWIIDHANNTDSMPGSGLCLRFADECAGLPTSRLSSGSGNPDAPPDGHWLQAQHGWWFSRPEFQHPGDALDAPPGSYIFYSQMIGGDEAGHIVPVVDWGVVRTTTGTSVETISIADLNDQRPSIRRDGTSSVLGYTTAYGNNPIAGLNPEADMSAEAEAKIDQIYAAIFAGGTSMNDGGKSIARSLADINTTVSRSVQRTAGDGKVQAVPQIQDNADTNTFVRRLVAQVTALQAAIATLASGSGIDPATLEAAVNAAVTSALGDLRMTGTVALSALPGIAATPPAA